MRNPIQSLGLVVPVPMHGVVRFLSKIPRLSSLAGNGLPERMRTTAFAFLGLTAAAGLALVAIFAQLSFHVLSPAPLPETSSGTGAVAAGLPLRQQRRPDIASARDAATASPATSAGSQGGLEPGTGGGKSSVDGQAVPLPGESAGQAPAGQDPPETVPAPEPAPAPAPEPVESPTGEAPTAAPVSTPLPEPVSGPGKSTAVVPGTDKEKADHDHSGAGHGGESHPKPAKPKPAKPSKPEPSKPEAAPAPEPSYEPTSPPVPQGKAQGWGKGKKDK